MDETTPMDHQAVVEKLLVEILKRNREQAAEIKARLDAISAKLGKEAATPTCDACGADLADRARMLLADGRVICGMCTQVPASQKIAPICGAARG